MRETTKTIVGIGERFMREILTKLRSIDVQEEEGKGMMVLHFRFRTDEGQTIVLFHYL